MAAAFGGDACDAMANDAWREQEERAVLEMAMLGRQIRRQHDGQIDVASRVGREAAHKLLQSVGIVVQTLQMQLTPQTYRQSLSPDVMGAWTETQSRYGIRILVASVQHWRNVVLNNQVFRLSDEVVALSLKLCRTWAGFGLLLKDIRKKGVSDIPRSRAVATLEALDRDWAAFEDKLFAELQVMHSRAHDPLTPLVRATELVRDLERIHQRYDLDTQVQEMAEDPAYQEVHRKLVETISHLNLVANPLTKGYGFTARTLCELEAVIQQCEDDQPSEEELSQNPSFVLAVDAMEAFNSLCAYFFKVKDCMDQIDPQLRDNKGLVKRLARWEASWRRATDHVLDPLGRKALETLMATICKAQALSPEFAEMCEECSADMFLALPRLVWLSFLASPAELSPEIQCILRHRFVEVRSDNFELGCYPGDEVQELLTDYGRTLDVMAAAVAAEALEDPQVQARVLAIGLEPAKKELVAGLLSQGAVLGCGGDLERYAARVLAPGPAGLEAQKACETFVRGLESWSIELQRHCARDWNAFVSVVVRSMNSDLRTLNAEVRAEAEAFEV